MKPDKMSETLQGLDAGRGHVIAISGVDGSGKTTLVRSLVEALEAQGKTTRTCHIHSWLKNTTTMPGKVRSMKSMDGISILDRSLYDNIAVLATRFSFPFWLVRLMTRCANLLYRSIDLRILLTVTSEDLITRRPNEDHALLMKSARIYNEIAHAGGFLVMASGENMPVKVLEQLNKT